MRYRWDPSRPTTFERMDSSSEMSIRASDAERNDVAERLSRHFADGRLDQNEFNARLDKATGATTRGDLHGLFDDLPRLPDESTPRPARRRRVLPVLLMVLVVAVVAHSTIWATRVPWLLVVVIGLLLWHRATRHHERRQGDSHPAR